MEERGNIPYVVVIKDGFSYFFLRRKDSVSIIVYGFENIVTLNQVLPDWLTLVIQNYLLIYLDYRKLDSQQLDTLVCISCSLCTFPLFALSLKKQQFYPVYAHQVET